MLTQIARLRYTDVMENDTPVVLFHKPVKCANPACGKTTWWTPSIAVRRKYCDRRCAADHRFVANPALALLRRLGGVTFVARQLGLPPRAVAMWGYRGIPWSRHSYLMLLAESLGITGITPTALMAASSEEIKLAKTAHTNGKANHVEESD
jgi:hypothetical protein